MQEADRRRKGASVIAIDCRPKRLSRCIRLIAVLVAVALPALARAAGVESGGPEAAGGHASSMGPVLLALIVIMVGGKVGGELLDRARQPAVLGELIAGVVIGNLTLFGYGGLEYLASDPIVGFMAELGVIILLFEVGLESDLGEMLRVGPSAFLVALLGVIAPFILGAVLSELLMPQLHIFTDVFIGATLCATSVGITARVMQDLAVTRSLESRIILGAAVIDDVLGLVVLAVVAGLAASGGGGADVSFGDIGSVLGKAALFLGLAIGVGHWISPRVFGLASRLRAGGMLISTALIACFTLAYLADRMGLAGIVGAFAAGLVMEEIHFREFRNRGEHSMHDLIRPISMFLAPIFFVRMGLSVDLTAFADPEIIWFALAITVAAVLGKQVCSLGVFGVGKVNRLAIGLGMIPRGEVGLIFAGIGRALQMDGQPVLNDVVFSALVVMVMVTTLVTPPVLRVAFMRGGSH